MTAVRTPGVTTSLPSRFAYLDRSGTGVALVTVAAVVQTLAMGRAVAFLNVALVVSLGLWAASRAMTPQSRVLPVFITALIVQLAHLVEEYRAGFQRSFPALFGYIWEDWRFLAFNAIWLGVFAGSAWALARGRRLGYLGAFFLAIGGGIGNGLGHLALAARAGGYFPGTFTALLSLAAGTMLLIRLLESTPRRQEQDVRP